MGSQERGPARGHPDGARGERQIYQCIITINCTTVLLTPLLGVIRVSWAWAARTQMRFSPSAKPLIFDSKAGAPPGS